LGWPGLAHAADAIQELSLLNGGSVVAAILLTGLCVVLFCRLLQEKKDKNAAQAFRQITSLIEHTDCILWEARVKMNPTGWHWDLKFHPTAFSRRLFGDLSAAAQMKLWHDMQSLEREAMHRRAREAFEQKRAGYEQDFRTVWEGRTLWLHENVSINVLGSGEFWLIGLVSDITAQREAAEAQQVSETRLTHLLERTDTILWQAQYSRQPDGVMAWSKFFIPPSPLCRRIFNREPCEQLGFLWCEIGVPEELEMKQRSEAALSDGSSGYSQIFHVPKPEGDIWLSEHVSIQANGVGHWDMVGIITDITVRRAAEVAQQASEGRLRELLTRANCLLWEATVEMTPENWSWRSSIQPSLLCQKLFGALKPPDEVDLWRSFEIPELDEMNQRARLTLSSGLPGYEQIFQIIKKDGTVIWIQESVTIKSLAQPGLFSLVGVATDITAQRSAEIARLSSEEQLNQLLTHANCMLWQADVIKNADGEYVWEWFVPKSELYRRIAGEYPSSKPNMPWGRVKVPEFAQIETKSRHAMSHNLPQYEQEFRVILGEEVLWIHEQVSVSPRGDNCWKLEGVCIDITAKHRATEAQRASDAQLGRLLDVAHCMVWEAEVTQRADGTLAWDHFMPRSALYRKIFGETKEVRLLWHTKNVPELEEMRKRSLEAVKSHALGYMSEFHVVLPEGDLWLREDVTIKWQESGALRMIGVVTNISARRVAEAAVRVSEQRYRTLFQHTPVAIIEADFTQVGDWLEGLRKSGVQDIAAWFEADPTRVHHGASLVQLTNINRTALDLFRTKSADALRRRRHLLETPDSLHVIQTAFIGLWAGRTSLECELVMHDVEGTDRHMNLRWWIGRKDSGIDLTQTVMVYIDLTELKKAEAELATEKERLAVTLRAMTEGVITTDEAGRILFLNPAAATLLEWDAEQAIGRLVTEICVFQNNRDGSGVEVPISRVAQGDVVINLPLQTRLVTRSGVHKMVEGCCAPIHSAASKVMGAVLVFRDVTEHERLEEELVRATRLESVGVLAGGIAHDFNNILTAVMGNIALGMLDVPADSPTGVSLKAAEKAALRARDLTQQLLTFAKGGEPVRTAVQLETIIREMITFSLHGSPVKAMYEFSPNLWPADADKGQIGRVVQNLAINSVQAMPTGGMLRVKAMNDRVRGLTRPGLAPGDYILLTMADTGEGISPENIARIFDPYFTTKKTGSGLGLAAVYSIIKKHRGHIEVESRLGQGTTFRLWLPALHEKTDQAVTRPPLTSSVMTGRVLFMDDDEIIRAMATKLLHRFGLDVVCAGDGAEMVERYRSALAENRPFSLVVMDLTVPGGMGGLPALAKLKEINPHVKAIVSSGYSSDPVLANFREHGFCAVISKPYDIHEFSRVLRAALAE